MLIQIPVIGGIGSVTVNLKFFEKGEAIAVIPPTPTATYDFEIEEDLGDYGNIGLVFWDSTTGKYTSLDKFPMQGILNISIIDASIDGIYLVRIWH